MSANSGPTVFTDGEFENLKRFCSTHEYFDMPFPMTQVRLEAILRRLEAAEMALGSMVVNDDVQKGLVKKWLDTKGMSLFGIPVKLDKTLPPKKWLIKKNRKPEPRYISEDEI